MALLPSSAELPSAEEHVTQYTLSWSFFLRSQCQRKEDRSRELVESVDVFGAVELVLHVLELQRRYACARQLQPTMGNSHPKCRHFQEPWPMTSTHVAKRNSPFWILVPLHHLLPLQPARLFGDTSMRYGMVAGQWTGGEEWAEMRGLMGCEKARTREGVVVA